MCWDRWNSKTGDRLLLRQWLVLFSCCGREAQISWQILQGVCVPLCVFEISPGFSFEFVHKETNSKLRRQSQRLQLYLECNWNVHWHFLLLKYLVNPFTQFRLEDKAALFNRAGKDMNCQVSYVQDMFTTMYNVDIRQFFSSHCFSLDHQKQS